MPGPRFEIELAEIGGQHQVAVALVDGDHFGRHHNRRAHRGGLHLNLARPLEHVIGEKHLRQRAPQHNRAVVLQHQHGFLPDIGDQPLAFFAAHRDAFEIVVGDQPFEEARIEIGRLKPAFGGANRHRIGRVRVDDGVGVRQLGVEHRMLREARKVHRIRTVIQLIARRIDLEQVAGGHFAPQQAERVDEEIILPRHAQGDVVVDALAPAHVVENTVSGGQIQPRLPFLGAAIMVAL